jgi:hypothetical protein
VPPPSSLPSMAWMCCHRCACSTSAIVISDCCRSSRRRRIFAVRHTTASLFA